MLRGRKRHRACRSRGRIEGFELQCWMRRRDYWAEGRNRIVTFFWEIFEGEAVRVGPGVVDIRFGKLGRWRETAGAFVMVLIVRCAGVLRCLLAQMH